MLLTLVRATCWRRRRRILGVQPHTLKSCFRHGKQLPRNQGGVSMCTSFRGSRGVVAQVLVASSSHTKVSTPHAHPLSPFLLPPCRTDLAPALAPRRKVVSRKWQRTVGCCLVGGRFPGWLLSLGFPGGAPLRTAHRSPNPYRVRRIP